MKKAECVQRRRVRVLRRGIEEQQSGQQHVPRRMGVQNRRGIVLQGGDGSRVLASIVNAHVVENKPFAGKACSLYTCSASSVRQDKVRKSANLRARVTRC